MGEVVTLRPHAGLASHARDTHESAALAAVHDHEAVFHWYPLPNDEEYTDSPLYAWSVKYLVAATCFAIVFSISVHWWRG